MNRKTKQTFLAIFTLFFTILVQAQVTIGSLQSPATGALLDLKEKTNGSSDRGLGMPRVALMKLAPATPSELSASIGSTGNWDMDAHIGLTIYNVNDEVFNPATCKIDGAPIGLYVWDGSRWQGLGTKASIIDTADPIESETATTLTDRDGNTYAIASFGTAGTWMTENLRTQTAPGLIAMTESAAASTANMYYAYPKADGVYVPGKPSTWTIQKGLLYNWAATMNRRTCNTTDQGQVAGTNPGANEVEKTDGFIQGICPFGWHVPSDREWNQLEQEIATKTSLYAQTLLNGTWTTSWETTIGWRGTAHGTAMKSKTGVTANPPNGDSKTSIIGGIDILLVGYGYNGDGLYYGLDSYLWSSSSHTNETAWYRGVRGPTSTASVYRIRSSRFNLFSVRCKKD